jgi:forkhead box protein K
VFSWVDLIFGLDSGVESAFIPALPYVVTIVLQATETRPPTMSTSTGLSKPVDNISAYYCLLFPNFAYYLQTLSVSIGRRPNIRSGASASSSDVRELVDIDLGPLSQVSRLHARIDYDEEQELFVLVVLGRNGAWVDGVWYASGRKVPLGAR